MSRKTGEPQLIAFKAINLPALTELKCDIQIVK